MFVRSKARGRGRHSRWLFVPASVAMPHASRRLLQHSMPITVCPIAWKGGRCRNVRCRLRHDIVQCGPCGCFVLREGLTRHRRGEEHRQNCGFLEDANPPLPYPRVPKPPPQRPARSRAMKIPSDGRPERSERRMIISEEKGLTFKSTAVGQGGTFATATVPIVIERVARQDSLTLIDVKLSGAESES